MKPIVRVENLVFEYPGKRALNGVSFEIEPGWVVALVGPNGAGKSTLLRCLTALETPFSGRVLVDGIDTCIDPRACHRTVGYLPDFFGLYDELTVYQCLTYTAAIHELPDSTMRDSLQQVIEDLDLLDFVNVKAKALSRGLRQRLAIGQSLIHHPKLLFLDEPAAGLDPVARSALSKLIRKLNSQGITILVSSHILSELADYSTHMLTIDSGMTKGLHSLSASASSSESMVLRLSLLNTPENLGELLGAITDVVSHQLVEGNILLECSRTPETQHNLLKALVNAGLQVTSFTEEKQSMEALYLSQLDKKLDKK